MTDKVIQYVLKPMRTTQSDYERGHASMNIVRGLPFYWKGPGHYVHRVRSAHAHFQDRKHSHSSVSFWCGNSGFVGDDQTGIYGRNPRTRGKLYSELPDGAIHCAVCEGKATGAGLNGAPIICGRPVRYSPRI